MLLKILIQNIIVVSSIVFVLRNIMNYLALPQFFTKPETVKEAEAGEGIFKNNKELAESFSSKSLLSSKSNIFYFIVLIALLITAYNFCELKNIISTLIFFVISIAIVYPFMPRDMPADGGYAGYSIKSWVLFIIALILSVTISTLFLFYFF